MKIRTALLATVFAMSSTSVQAADLGSDCCSDLEERIAELEATTARKGNRKVTLQVYGQVNAGLLHVDVADFDDTRVTQMGSDTQGTFVGFRGTARISPTLSAGYVLEVDFRQLGLLESGLGEQPDPAVRQSFLYLRSDNLGALSIGRAGQATQQFDEITTANTVLVARPLSLQPLSDAYLTGIDTPFDGRYRDIVRYDSPSLGGFMFSASWGAAQSATTSDGNTYDVALRYAGEFGGFRVLGGLGYRHDEDFTLNLAGIGSFTFGTGDVETFLASGSVMHLTSGLFMSAYYADQDWDDVGLQLTGWHLQGGIEQKMFTSLGATTIYAEYGETEFDLGGSDDMPVWGLGMVQAIDAAALDLYLGWRQYDADDLIGEKVDVIQAGARIQF